MSFLYKTMLSLYHLEKNVSFFLEGFEKTPSILPGHLPWASLVTKEFLTSIIDDMTDNKIILHGITTFILYEKISENTKKFIASSTDLTDEEKKQIVTGINEKILKNNHEKALFDTNVKRNISKFIDEVNLEELFKINKLYIFRINGPYVVSLYNYLNLIDKDKGLVTMDVSYVRFTVIKKWLKEYINSYSWRMENFSSIQKFIFHTRDIYLGVTNDLRYIQDLLCPKLYAYVDTESVDYKGVGFSMKGDEISLSAFMNLGGEKVSITETEKIPMPDSFYNYTFTENTEGVQQMYVTGVWKSEALVILPLLVEFFTLEYKEDIINTNRESFTNVIVELIKQHLKLPREKISELIDYYFADLTLPELKELFVDVIYIYLNPIDEELRNDFKDDAERMMEVFNQYEQSL